MQRATTKKHTYNSLSEESEHLPASKRSRKNQHKKKKNQNKISTILSSSNDKTNNDRIMRPPVDANANENENKNDENNFDMWSIGAMLQGVMCIVYYFIFNFFIYLFLFLLILTFL